MTITDFPQPRDRQGLSTYLAHRYWLTDKAYTALKATPPPKPPMTLREYYKRWGNQ